jgi:hypothetical protein
MLSSRRSLLGLLAAGAVAGALLPSVTVTAALDARAAASISDGVWDHVGPMPSRRADHLMVRLADGRVLVAGGGMANDARSKRSADIYNPQTDRWSAAEPMHRTRSGMSGVLMRNGQVLVVGGVSTVIKSGGLMNVVLRSAEIYHPGTDRWTKVAAMHDRRLWPIVELLPRGQVLVAGGASDPRDSRTAEIYNPRSGRWRMTESMSVPRYLGASARLPNGNILVAGGKRDPTTHRRTAERYRVRRHVWRAAGQFDGARRPRLFSLPSGKVLAIAGEGRSYSPTRRVAMFNPWRDSWRQVDPLPSARAWMPVVSLNGFPLVLGGAGPGTRYTTATGFLWRPGRQGWVRVPRMPQPLSSLGAVRLRDGSILAAGGQSVITEGTHVPTRYAFRYCPRGSR